MKTSLCDGMSLIFNDELLKNSPVCPAEKGTAWSGTASSSTAVLVLGFIPAVLSE